MILEGPSDGNLAPAFARWPQPHAIRLPVMSPWLTSHEADAVAKVLKSGWVGSISSTVDAFEKDLSDFLGVETLSVANGSVALTLALAALDVSQSDEVIVPSFSYAAVASSIVHRGAIPVFADVSGDSWQLSADSIEKVVTARTRGVILPHSYGVAGPVGEIREFCDLNNLFLIEDVAEAFGGKYAGRMLGSFGDIATFSFFPNKLITTGEGGAVATSSSTLMKRLRLLRGQGMSSDLRYWFIEPGFNFRMSAMQAALGRAQLGRIDEIFAARQQVESRYEKLLQSLVSPPTAAPPAERAPWLFSGSFEVPTCPETVVHIAEKLAEKGIETRPLFFPLDQMPAFSRFARQDAPIARGLVGKGITLPSAHNLSERDQVEIAQIIEKGVRR